MALEEKALVDGAVAQLREMLPPTWTVEPANRAFTGAAGAQPKTWADCAIDLRSPHGGMTTFAVEAKSSFDPRSAEQLLAGLAGVLRGLGGGPPILAIAPWMSSRTQGLLAKEGINYLDLTGNARIALDHPPLYIRFSGATRNPQPAPRARASVRGPKAARVIRLLLDVAPPYGLGEIAAATGLAPGYVSRLLETLDREALIERARRGPVETVDIPGLIRRWAESYDVLRTNRTSMFLGRQPMSGLVSTLQWLSEGAAPVAVTGSFAAALVAPVASSTLLLAYCDDVATAAEGMGLLPAREGANVILLSPFDPVVWERGREELGVRFVAYSQAVVDCLTGTGRMPAEGEALLEWMMADESRWRLPSLGERPKRPQRLVLPEGPERAAQRL